MSAALRMKLAAEQLVVQKFLNPVSEDLVAPKGNLAGAGLVI